MAVNRQFPDAKISVIESSPYARAHLEKSVANISVVANEAEEVGDLEGGYDCVTLLQTLEHVADPLRLCREIHGKLVKDGLFLVTVPNCRSYQVLLGNMKTSQCYGNASHLQFFSRRTLLQTLSEAGFTTVRRLSDCEHYGDGRLRSMARALLRSLAISTELRVVAVC